MRVISNTESGCIETVICDTNIWYKIAEGAIKVPIETNSKCLVSTLESVEELCTSPLLLRDYHRYRQAVIAFYHNYGGIITLSPVEYLKVISGHPYDDQIWDGWDSMENLLKFIVNNESPPDSFLSVFQESLKEYNREKDNTMQRLQNIIQTHRETITNTGRLKRDLSTRAAKQVNKELAQDFVREVFVGGLDLAWDKIELFMCVFEEWMHQQLINKSLKMNHNDWVDLVNLVYVQPGYLYWTHDEKKTKVYAINRKLYHYFIPQR